MRAKLMMNGTNYSTLFPYTTLFRSSYARTAAADSKHERRVRAAARACDATPNARKADCSRPAARRRRRDRERSEEHTSELQSRPHLVCRLMLEKKKQ